jgi:CheY-like chemotaxis protein
MFAYSAHDRKSPEFPELTGKRIVIIDDEAVISVDYWFQLLEIGARPQAVLPTNTGALSFLETHLVDAAILDYRLRDGTSEPVMAWLRDHGTPFVIISGWVQKLPNPTTGAAILEKPASSADLRRALASVFPKMNLKAESGTPRFVD